MADVRVLDDLPGGMAHLVVGSGEPVVMLPGLSGSHAVPEGMDRAQALRTTRHLARWFEVHWIQRRAGLTPGTSIEDMARDHAEALTDRFGRPMPVVGVSTGASIALELAATHPEVVGRLVVLAGACRLGDEGRRAQWAMREAILRGEPGRAWAELGPMLAANPTGGRLLGALLCLSGRSLTPEDPTDLLVTIEAEDRFDLCDRLGSIAAATLVIGGGRDGAYGDDLIRATAEGIPGAVLSLHPDDGHLATVSSREVQREVVRFLRSH